MKLLVVVGTNAPFSYNRFLAKFIAKRYADKADFEVKEIDQIKPFSRTDEPDEATKNWIEDIKNADGVILTTPEYDHAIPAALKSALEWLSSSVHPFHDKPVVIVSTSPMPQGASRSQTRLKSILG